MPHLNKKAVEKTFASFLDKDGGRFIACMIQHKNPEPSRPLCHKSAFKALFGLDL